MMATIVGWTAAPDLLLRANVPAARSGARDCASWSKGRAAVTTGSRSTIEERLLLERIVSDDFAWFDTHEGRVVGMRLAVPGEFLIGKEDLLGCGLTIVVLVNRNELAKALDLDGPWITVVRDE